MKQKIVIKVEMRCDKCKKAAMSIAATAGGVTSVAVQGKDKDEIVVAGNDVDVLGLCTALKKKKLQNPVLISVEEVKDPKPEEKKAKENKVEEKKVEEKKTEEKKGEEKKKDEQKEDDKKPETNPIPPPYWYNYPPPYYNYPPPPPPNYPVPRDENQLCSIL